MLNSLDAEANAQRYQTARPFPHLCIEQLLPRDAARRIAAAYPSYEEAQGMGRTFTAVNEKKKIQITDYERFPSEVKALADALAQPEFIRQLEVLTGIPNLIWDPGFSGGGMHETASSGHLDVHVDFNFNESLQLHRRLNLLIYLNEGWRPEWGGAVELWDDRVTRCHHSVLPELGRAVLFTTSEISYHGVTAVTCPPSVSRKSFAVYYYTKEPPTDYRGVNHSTVFKARPHEYKKKYVDMPIEQFGERVRGKIGTLKGAAKSILRR